MMANIIEIKVQVPNGYWGDLEIIVWNSHYDDDVPIDLCGMSVISVGNNMPCLDVTTQVAHDERAIDSKTLPDGRTMRRGMSIVLKGVCYIHADQRYFITFNLLFWLRYPYMLSFMLQRRCQVHNFGNGCAATKRYQRDHGRKKFEKH